MRTIKQSATCHLALLWSPAQLTGEKRGKCRKWKSQFKFANAYNVISTYPLLTYVLTNIFTVQLFFRLHREPLQCPFDSSNWLRPFLDSPLFLPAECTNFYKHNDSTRLLRKDFSSNSFSSANNTRERMNGTSQQLTYLGRWMDFPSQITVIKAYSCSMDASIFLTSGTIDIIFFSLN